MTLIGEALKRAQQAGNTSVTTAIDTPEGALVAVDARPAAEKPPSDRTESPVNGPFTPAWDVPPGGRGHEKGNGKADDVRFQLDVGPGGPFEGFEPAVRERLIVGRGDRHAMPAAAVEQYRKLAATLHSAQIESEIKVLMVTSAVAGEGKTLTSANLALTLSESYRRDVLLVDADLRRPGMHQIFRVAHASGLSDRLKSSGDGEVPLVEISPRLMLLPAGQPDPDPMAILTSQKMRRIVQEAAARFDWVIIDVPPVGLLTDASLLARLVDKILLVVQAGSTDYPIVKRAIAAVGREKILGVVLNRVEMSDSSYGYKYHKYYASYYGPKTPDKPGAREP